MKGRGKAVKSTLSIGSKDINISEVGDVALRFRNIVISKESRPRLQKNFIYLKKKSKEEVIYGLNTGFGPMAHIFISKEKQIDLQYNLIRSHAMGLGEYMSIEQTRAIMFVRLQTLLKGYSGVDAQVCDLLAEFLNRGITPIVYKHGSVGASGDLVQLAHIAQALIGEGKVSYKGEIMETSLVFKKILKKDGKNAKGSKGGVEPLKVQLREGLALINGTSAMSGIGALNVHFAKILVHYSILASSLLFEIVQASEEYFSKEISEVRPHIGQKKVGELMCGILAKSKCIRREDTRVIDAKGVATGNVSIGDTSPVLSFSAETIAMQQSRQEIYSIRCAVQVLGPIFDEVMNATHVVETEMNSVTDNPIVFSESGIQKIVHGGNFHGDYVSYEMDKLKIAITKLSIFSERKLNFLLNDKVNKMFPPFLNRGVVGLDLGLQGLQFVATSTTAENQSLSMPVSVHSISCNNDNQDIVSMGTNSALIADKVVTNTFDVLAIELIALSRAVEFLGIEKKISPATSALYADISSICSADDLVQRDEVQAVVDMLKSRAGDLFL